MMEYEIVEVDLHDRELLGKANRLVGETFGSEVPEDKLEKITWTNGANKSLYLAATQDGEVIGFNAFHLARSFFERLADQLLPKLLDGDEQCTPR
jgi:hypothetical protein